MSGGGRSRGRAWLANGLLVGVSVGLTLLAFEVGVRLFVDMSLEVPRAVYDVDPDELIHFLPHRERTYETREFVFTVRTNRFGRRDVEWEPETLRSPESLLFIGDSLIVGYGVEHAWTVPSRLEVALAEAGDPVEVLNFGIPGGSPIHYERLLHAALELGVGSRVVLVGIFVGNDFYPQVLEEPPKPRAEPEPETQAPSRWRPRSELARFVRLRVSQSARMVGWVLTLGRWLGVTLYDTGGSYIFLREQTAEQEALVDRILAIVGRMKRTADARGRTLYGVVIPNKIQVENFEELESAIYDPRKPNRRTLAYCRSIGMECLDLLPPFGETWARDGDPLYFPVDRHFTPAGNDLAAREIAAFLRARGVPGETP